MDNAVPFLVFGGVAVYFLLRMIRKPKWQREAEEREKAQAPKWGIQGTAAQVAPTPRFDPGPSLADNLNLVWDIAYTDRNGESTERRITVRSLHGKRYPKFAFAFCHLRNEMRHFDLYSITRATEADTGFEVPVTYQLIPWIGNREDRLRAARLRTTAEADVSAFGVSLIVEAGGETFTVAVEHASANGEFSTIRGKAKRARTDTKRAWSGQKTFYSNSCTLVALAETGEVFDPDATFRILASGQVPVSPSSVPA